MLSLILMQVSFDEAKINSGCLTEKELASMGCSYRSIAELEGYKSVSSPSKQNSAEHEEISKLLYGMAYRCNERLLQLQKGQVSFDFKAGIKISKVETLLADLEQEDIEQVA